MLGLYTVEVFFLIPALLITALAPDYSRGRCHVSLSYVNDWTENTSYFLGNIFPMHLPSSKFNSALALSTAMIPEKTIV